MSLALFWSLNAISSQFQTSIKRPKRSLSTDCNLTVRCDAFCESGVTAKLRPLRGGSDARASIPVEEIDIFHKFKRLLCTSRFAMIKTFRSLDRDDAGVISKPEFADALQDLGLFANSKDTDQLFDVLDENKDGTINFEVRRNLTS